jgi:hypothetical protein
MGAARGVGCSLWSQKVVAQLFGFSITAEQGKGQAGNVSSEQILLKPLGWTDFLSRAKQAVPSEVNPSTPNGLTQQWIGPGDLAPGRQSYTGQEA